jgi:hypothetical protein
MGKTYKDNPNKWRKHSGKTPKPWKKNNQPQDVPKQPLTEEKHDPYWNHH